MREIQLVLEHKHGSLLRREPPKAALELITVADGEIRVLCGTVVEISEELLTATTPMLGIRRVTRSR